MPAESRRSSRSSSSFGKRPSSSALIPALALHVRRLESGEALLPPGPALHRFFQLGDDRFHASLLEHRIEMRFSLLALRPDDHACERAKIGETAALVCR